MSVRQGSAAEDKAQAYLEAQGLVLKARNYRTRRGELDLVMLDGATLVCVEVKYRASARHGQPFETVNYAKQQRLRAAFMVYLVNQRLNPAHISLRFDVVSITRNDLIWLKNVII